MNNLYELTAKELRDKFLSDELSAVEIVNSFYERIEKVEDKVKSFVSLRKDIALNEAKKLDEKKKNGEKLGKLAGIPIAIKDNILITFQETPYDMFESIRSRVENPNTKLASKDISYLAYILIDTIVDNYLLVLDEVETEIDDIENKLVESADRGDLENILSLKQNIAVLKKFISPVRELISKLQTRSMLNYFHEDMKYYLSDLNDHGIIVFDTVDMLNNRATELIQLYHSMISNTMNEIMKILAIISTIFMPLSFIVGLYGMNFEYMPELKWHYGYFISIGLMVGLVILMIIYFKKKKWF